MNVRTVEVCCPRCNFARDASVPPIRHLAGAEGDDALLWFTCGRMKYELPDAWATLGTPEAIRVGRMPRPHRTACMACGRMVDCTDKDGMNGATRWVCYRCTRTGGTVGWYVPTLRDHYDPDEDIAHITAVDPDATDVLADAVEDGAHVARALSDDLFAEPEPVPDEPSRSGGMPCDGEDIEAAVRRVLAENRTVNLASPEPEHPSPPPIPLTIPPDSPFHDCVQRTGSTSHADTLGRPEDIPGTSLRARLRRADLRIARFLAGLD